MSQEKSIDESIAEILGRWSVTDLREQTDADLNRGDDLFYKASGEMKVITKGTQGLIDWWKIESNGKHYEARRFKNFVFCSCKSFAFSKKLCKHLALTCGVYCINCHEVRATNGKFCWNCHTARARFIRPQTAITV